MTQIWLPYGVTLTTPHFLPSPVPKIKEKKQKENGPRTDPDIRKYRYRGEETVRTTRY